MTYFCLIDILRCSDIIITPTLACPINVASEEVGSIAIDREFLKADVTEEDTIEFFYLSYAEVDNVLHLVGKDSSILYKPAEYEYEVSIHKILSTLEADREKNELQRCCVTELKDCTILVIPYEDMKITFAIKKHPGKDRLLTLVTFNESNKEGIE